MTMHKVLVYAAYGWLSFTGVMHFIVDVAAQYLRGKRAPGVEATLYYGLNTSFALGQLLVGALGLWLAFRSREVLDELPVVALSLLAAVGWFAIASVFMEYWQPRLNTAIFGALVVVAALTSPSSA